MSSISEALKRAQQERERLRSGPTKHDSQVTPATEEPSLASVVLKPHRAGGETPAPSGNVTPIADALRNSNSPVSAVPTPQTSQPSVQTTASRMLPTAPSAAERARQQVAETIVEDYASKVRLNLPQSIVVYHDRSGEPAEQYRKMRDRLMAANPKRESQTLVLTSTVAGEGKTTTLLNLGLSLVEIRSNRVLMIDGSLHTSVRSQRGSLTTILRLQQEKGITDALQASDDDVQKYLKATPWHNLFVMPTGVIPSAAAATEMLKSAALSKFLRRLRANFDWILIDAPSVHSSFGSDASLLGLATDGVYVVSALHRTPQKEIQSAIRRLKSANLPLQGCILTHG